MYFFRYGISRLMSGPKNLKMIRSSVPVFSTVSGLVAAWWVISSSSCPKLSPSTS